MPCGFNRRRLSASTALEPMVGDKFAVLCPLHFVNEPAVGERCNAQFVLSSGSVDGGSRSGDGGGVGAATETQLGWCSAQLETLDMVECGAEILASYGGMRRHSAATSVYKCNESECARHRPVGASAEKRQAQAVLERGYGEATEADWLPSVFSSVRRKRSRHSAEGEEDDDEIGSYSTGSAAAEPRAVVRRMGFTGVEVERAVRCLAIGAIRTKATAEAEADKAAAAQSSNMDCAKKGPAAVEKEGEEAEDDDDEEPPPPRQRAPPSPIKPLRRSPRSLRALKAQAAAAEAAAKVQAKWSERQSKGAAQSTEEAPPRGPRRRAAAAAQALLVDGGRSDLAPLGRTSRRGRGMVEEGGKAQGRESEKEKEGLKAQKEAARAAEDAAPAAPRIKQHGQTELTAAELEHRAGLGPAPRLAELRRWNRRTQEAFWDARWHYWLQQSDKDATLACKVRHHLRGSL
eukprot:SAG11_NODE_2709_length_3060_cov_2.574806_3_plen_461_part_00